MCILYLNIVTKLYSKNLPYYKIRSFNCAFQCIYYNLLKYTLITFTRCLRCFLFLILKLHYNDCSCKFVHTCGYVINSGKNTAGLKGMCIFKGFDTYFQISLQNVLPISTPTGSGAASGKHGCVRDGASGRRGESKRELGGRSGPRGDDKGFDLHPEQNGQHRRFVSSNLIQVFTKSRVKARRPGRRSLQ